LFLCQLIKHCAMKAYGGEDVQLTSSLVGSECSASRPSRFTTGKEPRYPLGRRLGGPQSRSGQRGEEKILDPTRTRLTRSQSLYRLRYPGSSCIYCRRGKCKLYAKSARFAQHNFCRSTTAGREPNEPNSCEY
jgi:hypothetical protein